MPRTLKKILYCGMALMEVSPMLLHTASVSAKSRRTAGYYALPKYLKRNLDVYYGHKTAIRIASASTARRKANEFEKLWISFNNNPAIKYMYGHMPKSAYAVRLKNEQSISYGDMNGTQGANNVHFYGWLQKSLSRNQKKAIRNGQPAKGLTKTQRDLLGKYGITNQMFARGNLSDLSTNDFKDIDFPFAAHLSNAQKRAIHGNERLDGLSNRQMKVLREYGIPAENGMDIETGYSDYISATLNNRIQSNLKATNKKSSEKNKSSKKGIIFNGNDTKPVSNSDGTKLAQQYENAAKNGTRLPKYVYATEIFPDGSKSVRRLPAQHPKEWKQLIDVANDMGATVKFQDAKSNNIANIDKINGNGIGQSHKNEDVSDLAADYLPDVKALPKDKDGHNYYNTIVNGKPVRFTLINGKWQMSNLDGTAKQASSNNKSNSDNSNSDSDSDSDGGFYGSDSDSDSDTPTTNQSDNSNNNSDSDQSYNENGNTGNYNNNSNNSDTPLQNSDSSDNDSSNPDDNANPSNNSDNDSDNDDFSDNDTGTSDTSSDNSNNNSSVNQANDEAKKQEAAIQKKKEDAEKAKQEASDAQKAAEDARNHKLEQARDAAKDAGSQKHDTSIHGDYAAVKRDQKKANSDKKAVKSDTKTIHLANHNLGAVKKDNKLNVANIKAENNNAKTDQKDRTAALKALPKQTKAVQTGIQTDIQAAPMTSSQKTKATKYFKSNPDMIMHPASIKNPSAKTFVQYAVTSPTSNTLYSKDPSKDANKVAKNKKNSKGTTLTNDQLLAQDSQKISSLYKQIDDIEHHVQQTKRSTSTVKSISALPYDGYSETRQTTGKYAVFSKPEDTPRAKEIVNRKKLTGLNKQDGNYSKFWIADQIAKCSDGNTYYHVMSMNGNVSGWINSKGLNTVKLVKSKQIPKGGFLSTQAIKKAPKGLNPDFVNAYEGLIQKYVSGDRKIQKLAGHKFNPHQAALARMYSTKDLNGKNKMMDNIASRFQSFVKLQMNIPQYTNQAVNQSKLNTK